MLKNLKKITCTYVHNRWIDPSTKKHKSLKIVFPFFGFLYTQTPSVDVVRYSFCNKPRFKGSNKSSNFQFWSIYFQNFTNQNFTRFIHINRAKIFINRTKFHISFSTARQYMDQYIYVSVNILMYRSIYYSIGQYITVSMNIIMYRWI